MKIIALFIVLVSAAICGGQTKLNAGDLTNLVAVAELYSQNPNASGEEFAKSIDALRTPLLNNLADTLIAVGKRDKTILEDRFLRRPNDDELAMWYVIREIHYNRTSDKKKPRPNVDVAKDVLSQKIDSRWLLDNYYYRIRGGIAFLFNSTDLSQFDFKVEDLKLRNKTEKAIFFLNVIDALAGGRFRILLATKNNQQILNFAARLPKFNGKDYYAFKDFDYPDFDWIGYEETESYNKRHLGVFYIALIAHVRATAELKDKVTAQQIFRNSILSEPSYFKFSEVEDLLRSTYSLYK